MRNTHWSKNNWARFYYKRRKKNGNDRCNCNRIHIPHTLEAEENGFQETVEYKLLLIMDRIRCIGPFSALHPIASKPILNESVCEAIYFCCVVHRTPNRLLCQYMGWRYIVFFAFSSHFAFSSSVVIPVDYSAWNLSTLRICVIDVANIESAYGFIKKRENLLKSKANKR